MANCLKCKNFHMLMCQLDLSDEEYTKCALGDCEYYKYSDDVITGLEFLVERQENKVDLSSLGSYEDYLKSERNNQK